ncbi:hypothetical protein [Methylocella sp.]|uniref:hypothetical protein n=1 Tax=Methylocella sp. TaxID=1978226 RepID=UPI00378389B7
MARSFQAFLRECGFRTGEGVVDAWTWRKGVGFLTVVFVALTAIWRLVEPYAHRQMTPQTPLFDWRVFAAYAYLLFYAAAVLFIGISLYNLSAKRLRARRLPSGLAGLVPLATLFWGAARWLQPRVADQMSSWWVVGLDALLVGAIVWTVLELGFREPRGLVPR